MRAGRRVPGQPWELAIALIGTLSAALLVALALAPANDPQLAGRAGFDQLAGDVEDAVVAEWERFRADREGFSLSHVQRWRETDLAALEEHLETVERDDGGAASGEEPLDSQSARVFELLVREARRLEALGELEAARSTAQDALARSSTAEGRARAALVAIRCARALGDAEGARVAWTSIEAELRGAECEDGVSLLAANALAGAPVLAPDALALVQARLVEALCAGALPLGEGELRAAWLERIAALHADPGALARIVEHERVRALATLALERPARRLPVRPPDLAWRFEPHPARSSLLAWRAEGLDGIVAGFITRSELLARFAARLASAQLPPAGFALDFGLPGAAVEGEPIRARRELDAAGVGFELVHVDPRAAIAHLGRRVALLRGALLLTAALSLVASLATFRALRRSRRLAELKSSFVASVSHELRTPVASILLLAENLDEGRASDAATRERYPRLIRREAERLRRLVSDVLDFSRLERGRQLELRRESLSLRELLDGLEQAAREWAHKHGLELAIDFERVDTTAKSVNVDLDALRRALENLLDNARKHSSSVEIALCARTDGAALRIEVRDRGRGIAPEQRAKIFEPFERLESVNGAGGAGLGLAIVREIAREHGGEARALAPLDGVGARLEIELPLEQLAESGA